MALFEKAFTDFGMAMAKGGEAVLGLGGAAWVSAGKVVQKYIAQNPASGSIGGWQTVSALYVTFSGIAVSLTCLFFVIGWCRESIDIRANFTLENMFRFFIRFILTSQAIVYGLNLIRDFMGLIAVLTAGIATPMVEVSSDGVFTGVMDNLEGAECLVPGLLFLLGGIIGAAVVLVCSIKIMLAGRSSQLKGGVPVRLCELSEADPGFDGDLFAKGYAAAARKLYLPSEEK